MLRMGLIDGKICVVTGATSGIGFYTAQEIARMGGVTILVGRDQAKCEASVKLIQQETGNPAVEYLLADLSSQAQIRAAAAIFNAKYDHLDVLVNNAGGIFLRRKLSVDGIEKTFAVNHLAYFLLTNLLIEALKTSPSARVVNVSSGSHYGEHLDFNDLQLVKSYSIYRAYGRSKLANVLFSYELARRMAGTQVSSNVLSPGMVATDIWKKVNPVLTPLINPVIHRIGQTPFQGAQTSIYLAASPEAEGITGKYYANCKPVRSSDESYDLEAAKRLWEVSLQLTRELNGPSGKG
jgi:NAD(P)-dependent dehydrogenase (short-subunit alcohol dehydrogenase family)